MKIMQKFQITLGLGCQFFAKMEGMMELSHSFKVVISKYIFNNLNYINYGAHMLFFKAYSSKVREFKKCMSTNAQVLSLLTHLSEEEAMR